MGVVPVVQDLLEQVRVGTGRHRDEQVAREDPAAVGDAGGFECGLRLGEPGRQVEQHALELRVRAQRRGQQRPVATARVEHRAGSQTVAGVGQREAVGCGLGDHAEPGQRPQQPGQ